MIDRERMMKQLPRAALLAALVFGAVVGCFAGGGLAGPLFEGAGDAGGRPDADAGDDTWPDAEGLYSDADPGARPCEEGSCQDAYEDGRSPDCSNRVDEDGDGAIDCADFGCLGSPTCCVHLDRSWVSGEFDSCSTLEACDWGVFAADRDGDAVRVDRDRVVLGGDGVGEVGLYSAPAFGLVGEPTLSFLGGLSPELCTEQACRQALGVALTLGTAPTSGTGVLPYVGIVLDGEQQAVHLFVAGRHEKSLAVTRADLAATRGYAVHVDASGRVAFWVAVPGSVGEPVDLSNAPAHERAAALQPQTSGLRVAAFGRLHGARAAWLAQLRLERRACDEPGAWERPSEAPVLRAAPGGRVGRPAVALRPGGGYLAVVEADGFLAAATSADGLSWTVPQRILAGRPPTEYGRVAQRSPTLLGPRPLAGDPAWHLWFEGEAEVPVDSTTGVPGVAILHATSLDGIDWTEAEDPVVVDTAPGPGDEAQPAEPAVVALPEGGLAMLFVGRSPRTGETALYRATSSDGQSWTVWNEALELDGPPAQFEVDGIAEPAVVERGGVLQLWYVGRSGARSALGYAVSGDGGGSWERYGQVLEGVAPWEASRVRGPSVVVSHAPYDGTEMLLLWYEAGAAGQEQVGLATRIVPVLSTGG
jgi:hypothetical protein